MRKNGIYIAGAEQHAGKTFLTIGLIAGLKERLERGSGYLKPMGQKQKEQNGKSIGEDSYLVNEMLKLGMDLSDSAPFATGSGAAARFLATGEPRHILRGIQRAYQRLSAAFDFLVVEGTGHPGVGSVFGLSNGVIARQLRIPVLLVLDGGVGSTVDRYTLCSSVFEKNRVPILGVVLNRILPGKVDKIKELVGPWFEARGIPVFGYIPYQKKITYPSLRGLTADLCLTPQYKHGGNPQVSGFVTGAGRSDEVGEKIRENPASALIISARRLNLAEMAIARRLGGDLDDAPGAMVLCGTDRLPAWLVKGCRSVSLPLYSSTDSLDQVVKRLYRKVFKLGVEETLKGREIIQLVREHVDIEGIYQAVRAGGYPAVTGGKQTAGIVSALQNSLRMIRGFFRRGN